MSKKVTVLTATTGRQDLVECIKSVSNQTYDNIEHIVIVDGPTAIDRIKKLDLNAQLLSLMFDANGTRDLLYVELPKSIGKDRWNGHRIYMAGTAMADGDYVCFLDDDNTFEPDHVESLVKVIEKEWRDWAFSFRKLHDADGKDLGRDDCESLGKWPSVCGPSDYFVDVNCFMLPTSMAVKILPSWYRKFREPGQMEVDRALTLELRTRWPNYDSNYKYTVNYKVAGGPLSVQPEFFKNGNEAMLRFYSGKLPWHK